MITLLFMAQNRAKVSGYKYLNIFFNFITWDYIMNIYVDYSIEARKLKNNVFFGLILAC